MMNVFRAIFLLLLGFTISCNNAPQFLPKSNDLAGITLTLEDSAMAKMELKKDQAIEIGILKKESTDWVDGILTDGDELINTKLRLKGDWTDHLKSNKWSFRLRTDKSKTWNGMRTFSLQHPKTRDYLSEWVYHTILQKEDILATNYGFVNLSLNNKNLGVYAYEEHFEKQLIASGLRREGIIVKYNEDGFWDARIDTRESNINVEHYLESYLSSEIEPFEKSDVLKDDQLREQFELASTLLHQWRNKEAKASDIFDIEKTAKYLALCDVFQAYHSLVWHNLRFYYNPINSKLEPLGFDAFTESGPFDWVKRPFIGHGINTSYLEAQKKLNFWFPMFQDEVFYDAYVRALEIYSRKEYLTAFMDSISEEINFYETALKTEFSSYEYEEGKIYQRAGVIRKTLFPQTDSSPVAYVDKKDGEYHYTIMNYHATAIIPYAIGDKSTRILKYLKDATMVEAFSPQFKAPDTSFVSNIDADWLFYKIPGIDSVFSRKMYEYAPPKTLTPLQELLAQSDYQSNPILRITDSTVFVKTGNHTVSSHLVIPPNYTLYIEPGTRIDLTNGSAIVSYSPVQALGTIDKPIEFFSSDSSNNGFVVLGDKQLSRLDFVYFDNMHGTNINEWELTGCITFQNCKLEINNCRFTNNQSEDAVNFISSSVYMKKCAFENTYADALDADFCTGSIQTTSFSNISNDGIDISGSTMEISDCSIVSCSDKAISVGEHSTASIWRIYVENAVTGIAAKDLSTVSCENIELKDCMFGFSAYQKKPEFGGAAIKAVNVSFEDVDEHVSTDEQSSISID